MGKFQSNHKRGGVGARHAPGTSRVVDPVVRRDGYIRGNTIREDDVGRLLKEVARREYGVCNLAGDPFTQRFLQREPLR